MPETVTTTEVLLRAERHDGNDPIEATVHLPIVPRKGDTICIWDGTNSAWSPGGSESYVEIVDVVFCSWAPERIEVWVRMDGYDLSDVENALAAAGRNDQP